jgi:hypothetical protein
VIDKNLSVHASKALQALSNMAGPGVSDLVWGELRGYVPSAQAKERSREFLMSIAEAQGPGAVKLMVRAIEILQGIDSPFENFTHPDALPPEYSLMQSTSGLPGLTSWLKYTEEPLKALDTILWMEEG